MNMLQYKLEIQYRQVEIRIPISTDKTYDIQLYTRILVVLIFSRIHDHDDITL